MKSSLRAPLCYRADQGFSIWDLLCCSDRGLYNSSEQNRNTLYKLSFLSSAPLLILLSRAAWARRQAYRCFAWSTASSLWDGDVVGLWPEVHVLCVPCAAAGEHVHPAWQGGPVPTGDGPETGQGWLPLPAEPQQGPREDERGEIQHCCSHYCIFKTQYFMKLSCFYMQF